MFDSQALSMATLRLYLRSGMSRVSPLFHATVCPTEMADGLPLYELPTRKPRHEVLPSLPTMPSHMPRCVPSTVGATLVVGSVRISMPWRVKDSAADASFTLP